MNEIPTVRTVGGLLPGDLLSRVIAADADLPGLTSSDYHLAPGESPRQAANRAWSYLSGVFASFRTALERLPEGDPAVGLTRERWLGALLRELGYGRVPTTPTGGLVAADRSFPVSHVWQGTPVHLLGWGVDLDRRTKGVPGAADRAPHAMVQEYLNRSDDALWGVLSNGRQLRLLRDSTTLTGQAYVEFDLQTMFDGEVFSDFVLLLLLAHESRVEPLAGHVPGTAPATGTVPVPGTASTTGTASGGAPGRTGATDCWLERWRTVAVESGTRALGLLRDGVHSALETLGTGFLRHPANGHVNRALADGDLRLDDFHRGLLRLVYRMLFLFVAEDRCALLDPAATPVARDRYARYFSTARLRRLALRRHGTRHTDLWQGLSLVLDALGSEDGCPQLGLLGLGGLFDTTPADVVTGLSLSNDALLAAVRDLSIVQPKGQPRRTIDHRHLGAEELGSVYESLLELVPRHHPLERTFTLEALAGNDRKTSGSYYTPSSLIDLVLDEALDPVLDAAERDAPDAAGAERALLAVTVCDPACGSGHFLVAAARRIAVRLAAVRSGYTDPTPADERAALHDVVGRCLHGIDSNPMAAELAKVSLWLEALQPGRPLTFLDAHVKVGDALLGTTPALLAAGIPDDAYKPLEGDDKKWAAALKKRNRAEREAAQAASTQMDLFDQSGLEVSNAALRRRVREVTASEPKSLAEVHRAARRLQDLHTDPRYARARQVADTWCAAFVTRRTENDPVITHETLAAVEAGTAPSEVTDVVADLATRMQFFHWHLEFPHVFEVPDGGAATPTGWTGGFTCLVGNPPWERVKLQEKEFFAGRAPRIAEASNAAARKKLIAALAEEHPALWQEWIATRRRAEAGSHLLRCGGRFPLTGRGDVNTYSVFAEAMRDGTAQQGRAGVITPTGLATDATTAPFFADTLVHRRLTAFYDFENEARIFPGVHHSFRFAITSATGGQESARVRFAFYTRHISDVPDRRFELSPEEILLLNPNTGTLPVFRARADAEITLGIYHRHPVLIRESAPATDPWGLVFATLFHMANDSGAFRTATDLAALDADFDGWSWNGPDDRWLPLYEAKLLSHYDHRFATYAEATQAQLNVGSLPRLAPEAHDDPCHEPLPRYWIDSSQVDRALGDRWDRDWLFGWRDIARSSDTRTMISSVLPRSAVGHVFPLAFPADPTHVPLLQAVWSSLVFDYVARQKLSGTHLTYTVLKQLPCPAPEVFDTTPPWAGQTLRDWVLPRVLELTYTSHRLAGYARTILGLPDGADPGQPFRWLPERREVLRAELDAALFDVYGLSRPQVEHVLDSFGALARSETREAGEYRTRRLILSHYDALTEAGTHCVAYRAPLNPPPPHGPRHPDQRP